MFYITISNGLLEDDHHEKMGSSVWLFMWFIDKVTKIDNRGFGLVLGGKPINFDEITNIKRRTAQRYLARLKKEGYIEVKRTMRGVIVKVVKAKKRFGGDASKVAHHHVKSGASLVKSGASNKTVTIDRVVRQGSPPEADGKNVNLIMDEFFKINNNVKNYYKNINQRKAISDLIKAYGFDRVKTVVEKTLPKTNTLSFFPTITTPIQLQEKWASLESAVRKKQGELLNKPKVYFS